MVESVSKLYRLYLGFIIALAFFAQSIIPVGYMPQFNTGKFFEITICHGDDLAKVVVDEHMHPVKGMSGSQGNTEKSGSHYKSCPYSAVSSKNIALLAFLYHYTERLIYERFVDWEQSQLVSYFIRPPYEGRAPPKSYT